MPLRLSLKRHFFARSERVKCVDIHPTDPLCICALYDGAIKIYDFAALSLFREVSVSALPLRAVKFIAKKGWFVCGGDDCALRCFNINTLEKVKEISNAHRDYIRAIHAHPSKPYITTCSDDMMIKIWNYEDNWERVCTFEGHTHYVMGCEFNPRDPNILASCSLDRSIKVWGVPSNPGDGAVVISPHFTLLGHERGVNSISYSKSGERPYLVSGSDDFTVRIWDYQTKQCIQVLTGHKKNVCSTLFSYGGGHVIPILFSAGEDGDLRVWHALTYSSECVLPLNCERVWSLALLDRSQGESGASSGHSYSGDSKAARIGGLVLAVATDNGVLILKMGGNNPVVSIHSGKAVCARGFEICSFNLRALDLQQIPVGEKFHPPMKELGTCEIFPESVSHHPNGRFVAVIGDGEYIVYTAQALRSKAFGKCQSFAWSLENHFAVLQQPNKLVIYSNFEERYYFTPEYTVEEIFGGQVLGAKSADFICFYDWNTYRLVRKIDVSPLHVHWSPSGSFVALTTRESFDSAANSIQTQGPALDKLYVLSHDKYAVMAANTGQAREEDGGIEIAFELLADRHESVVSGMWISDCYVYISANGRLKTMYGNHIETLTYKSAVIEAADMKSSTPIDCQGMHILGYVPEQNRLYLTDKQYTLVAYYIYQSVIEYKVSIMRNDFPAAESIFPQIPECMHDDVAKFLLERGFREEAYVIAKDEDLKFQLALQLGYLQHCAESLSQMSQSDIKDKTLLYTRWGAIGDVALRSGKLKLAAKAFQECGDYSTLLLLYTSSGDAAALKRLCKMAESAGHLNIAFMCCVCTRDLDGCIRILLNGNLFAEASAFAYTYAPSRIDECVDAWKSHQKEAFSKQVKNPNKVPHLKQQFESALPASPHDQPELFKNYLEAKKVEEVLREFCGKIIPARNAEHSQELFSMDILEEVSKEGTSKLQALFSGLQIDAASDSTSLPDLSPPRDNHKNYMESNQKVVSEVSVHSIPAKENESDKRMHHEPVATEIVPDEVAFDEIISDGENFGDDNNYDDQLNNNGYKLSENLDNQAIHSHHHDQLPNEDINNIFSANPFAKNKLKNHVQENGSDAHGSLYDDDFIDIE